MKLTWQKLKFKKLTWSKLIFTRLGSGVSVSCVSYFNGVDAYAEFTSDIVLSGDFECSFDIITTNKTQDQAIFESGNFTVVGGYSLIFIDTPDGFQLIIPTDTTGFTRAVFNSFNELTDGNKNNVLFGRLNDVVYAKLNNVDLFNTGDLVSTSDVKLRMIAGGESRYFEGKMSNITVNSSTVNVILPMSECTYESNGTIIYKDRGASGIDAIGYNIQLTEPEKDNLTYGPDNLVYGADNLTS